MPGTEMEHVDRSRREAIAKIAAGALGGFAALGMGQVRAASVNGSNTQALAPGDTVDLDRKGMQLVITGSGSAMPDPLRGGASVAVIVDGHVLQFDCGRRVLENLMLVGINPMRIDHLFFTHMHFDHIADYDYYLITNWLAGRQQPVAVFGPVGTVKMSEGALKGMHSMDYSFVKLIVKNWPPAVKERPADEPPFLVSDIEPGVVVETDNFKVSCVYTDHLPLPDVHSLAYRVDSAYGSVAISGDTAPTDNMRALAKDVDVLVHECVKPDVGMTHGGKFDLDLKKFGDQSVTKTRTQTGHTRPSELGQLASDANVKRLIAYHLAPYTSVAAAIEMSSLYYGMSPPGPEIWSAFVSAIEKNYAGPVILAEDRMIFQVGV